MLRPFAQHTYHCYIILNNSQNPQIKLTPTFALLSSSQCASHSHANEWIPYIYQEPAQMSPLSNGCHILPYGWKTHLSHPFPGPRASVGQKLCFNSLHSRVCLVLTDNKYLLNSTKTKILYWFKTIVCALQWYRIHRDPKSKRRI